MKFPLPSPIQASEMRYFLPILCCACLVQVAPRPTDTVDSQADSGIDTAGVLPQWSARFLDPSVGSTLGGSETVLFGEGLRSDMQVKFGSEQAAVVEGGEDYLVLVVPPSDVVGPVDVRVSLGERELLLKRAFTYVQDRSDLAAGLGWVSRTDFVGVLGDDEDSSRASGYFGFLKELADADARRHMFPMQPGCGPLGPQPTWGFLTGVDAQMTLTGVSSELALPLGDGGLYFAADLDPAQVLPGSEYGLKTVRHPDGREASSEVFALLPDDFVFGDDELEAPTWSFRRQDELEFGWEGSTGDWMLGEFALYEFDDSGQLSEVEKYHCLVEDTEGEGVFSLSQSAFSKWSDEQILVLAFHSILSTPEGGALRFQDDNSELRMSGRVSRISALRTQ